MLSFLLACTDVPDPQGDDSIAAADPTMPIVVATPPCDACGGDCLLEQLSYPETFHISQPIDYASTPPAGGPHNPCWATWGTHVEPVLDDNFVHNLEHGAIAFVYGDTSLQAQGDALAKVLAKFMITTPYAKQSSAMSALSWGWRLSLGCFDDAALREFYIAHVNQAPESTLADPSAGCM